MLSSSSLRWFSVLHLRSFHADTFPENIFRLTMKIISRISATLALLVVGYIATAQTNPVAGGPTDSTPPTRDPHTPGFVTATELPDGAVPPVDADGNFIIGPTHHPAPEMMVQTNVPQGTVFNFTMSSADSKIYPGIAREPRHFRHARPHRSRPNSS